MSVSSVGSDAAEVAGSAARAMLGVREMRTLAAKDADFDANTILFTRE
jgi:hypothetical protein